MHRLLIFIIGGFIIAIIGLITLLINPFISEETLLKGSGVAIYVDESISMHPSEKPIKAYVKHLKNAYKDRVHIYTFSSKIKSLGTQKYQANEAVSLYHPLLKHIEYLPQKVPAIVVSDMRFYDKYVALNKSNVHYLLPSLPEADKAVHINKNINDDFYQRSVENPIEILIIKNTPDPTQVDLQITLTENNKVTSSIVKKIPMKSAIESFLYSFSNAVAEEVILTVKLLNNDDNNKQNDTDHFIFKKAGNQLLVHSWIFKANQDVQTIHNKIRPYRSVELYPKYFLNPISQIDKAKKTFKALQKSKDDFYLLFSPPYEVIKMFQASKKLFFLIPQDFDLEDNPFYEEASVKENVNIQLKSAVFKKLFGDLPGNVQLEEGLLQKTKPFKVVTSMPSQKDDLIYSVSNADKKHAYFFMRSNMVFMGFYPIHHITSSYDQESINVLDHFMQKLFLSAYKEYERSLTESLSGNYFLGSTVSHASILKQLKIPTKNNQHSTLPGDITLAGIHKMQNKKGQQYDINVRIPYKEFFPFAVQAPLGSHLLEDAKAVTEKIINQIPKNTTQKQIPVDHYYYLYVMVLVGFCLFAIMRNLYKNA